MRQIDAKQSNLDRRTGPVHRVGAEQGASPPSPRSKVRDTARGRAVESPPLRRRRSDFPPGEDGLRTRDGGPPDKASLPFSGCEAIGVAEPTSRICERLKASKMTSCIERSPSTVGNTQVLSGAYTPRTLPNSVLSTDPTPSLEGVVLAPMSAHRNDFRDEIGPDSAQSGNRVLAPEKVCHRRRSGSRILSPPRDPVMGPWGLILEESEVNTGLCPPDRFEVTGQPPGRWDSTTKGAGPSTQVSPTGRLETPHRSLVGWDSGAKGASPNARIRSGGGLESTHRSSEGWKSSAKGAAPSKDVRPRGVSNATGPPSGGWGSGAKGAGKHIEVRPRGLSDATSPPSGGWGSGAKGADKHTEVRSRGLSTPTTLFFGRGGSAKTGRRFRGDFGPLAPTSPIKRPNLGPRGAVQRSSAFVSLWDQLPKKPKSQNIRRHRDASNQGVSSVHRDRERSNEHMSSPPAMGITEEVYPWMD